MQRNTVIQTSEFQNIMTKKSYFEIQPNHLLTQTKSCISPARIECQCPPFKSLEKPQRKEKVPAFKAARDRLQGKLTLLNRGREKSFPPEFSKIPITSQIPAVVFLKNAVDKHGRRGAFKTFEVFEIVCHFCWFCRGGEG